MSPIHDPRFSPSRYRAERAEAVRESEQAERMEWIKPLGLFAGSAIGVAAMVVYRLPAGDVPFALGAYAIVLTFSLVMGVAGLWVASKLWLGGAGTLGLAIVRLLGIYVATDFAGMLTEPLLFFSWGIQGVVYLGLLCWLFELEFGDSVVLAGVTWLLKLIAGAALGAIIANL